MKQMSPQEARDKVLDRLRCDLENARRLEAQSIEGQALFAETRALFQEFAGVFARAKTDAEIEIAMKALVELLVARLRAKFRGSPETSH